MEKQISAMGNTEKDSTRPATIVILAVFVLTFALMIAGIVTGTGDEPAAATTVVTDTEQKRTSTVSRDKGKTADTGKHAATTDAESDDQTGTEVQEDARTDADTGFAESTAGTSGSTGDSSSGAAATGGGSSSGSTGGSASTGGGSATGGGGSATTPTAPTAPAPDPNAGKTWHEAVTEQVWVVDSPARQEPIWKDKIICSCGEVFDSLSAWDAHIKALGRQGSNGHSYRTESYIAGYNTIPEQGHWETRVIREAGWY